MKRKNLVVLVILVLIIGLAVAFYIFATSGVTENDVQGLPTCGTLEASGSLGCVER